MQLHINKYSLEFSQVLVEYDRILPAISKKELLPFLVY
jgi:hypothetical protein